MAIDFSDSLARTVEIRPALVHLKGPYAGAIEVPILLRDVRHYGMELDEFYLETDGEKHPLKSSRREFFNGQLRVLFFSERIRDTKQLPQQMQLHWGDKPEGTQCGMTLQFHESEDHSSND